MLCTFLMLNYALPAFSHPSAQEAGLQRQVGTVKAQVEEDGGLEPKSQMPRKGRPLC